MKRMVTFNAGEKNKRSGTNTTQREQNEKKNDLKFSQNDLTMNSRHETNVRIW